ncbi:MAG: T9SS type A sorting domain-containing protein, partial [Candidatus Cloacimonas sp.]|nr:T9SS type A sorting domain-containing protein [Candidatus Cloacimonas sp.]
SSDLAITTSDGGFIILVGTLAGEVLKFNSNFGLQWTADVLQDEHIGAGKRPIMELSNGDYLYCAGVVSSTSENSPHSFALVRITSEGVLVYDPYEAVPAISKLNVYPNPFAGQLSISLKQKVSSEARIIVFNFKGQQVDSFIPSDGTLIWQAQNLPAGIYFIKLEESGKVLQTSKVVLVK